MTEPIWKVPDGIRMSLIPIESVNVLRRESEPERDVSGFGAAVEAMSEEGDVVGGCGGCFGA